jgi:hypothetical protein
MNKQDQFKYSWFANLAYLDWAKVQTGNSDRLQEAAEEAFLLSTGLATRIFKSEGWRVPPIQDGGFSTDRSTGFQANLFENPTTGEKVLAIRGTETTNPEEFPADALEADLIGIGMIGVALTQMTSMYNYIARLIAPEEPTQDAA